MGFFSYLCKVCNMSVLNASSAAEFGLSNVVVVEYDGTVQTGLYDGYGRVGGIDLLRDGRNGLHDFEEFVYTDKEMREVIEANRTHSHYIHIGNVDEWMKGYGSKVPAFYHDVCYDVLKHKLYTGGSERCLFQGHFFEDEDMIALIDGNDTYKHNRDNRGVN